MKYIASIIICAFFAAGCKSASQVTLTGQPSWFHIEQDWQSKDIEPIYLFEPYPFWFCAFDRWVDEGTAKAYQEQFSRKHYGAEIGTPERDGLYRIPGELPYPLKLEDVPLDDDGVTLSFSIAPTSDPAVLIFQLTLHSAGRSVWREGDKDDAGFFLFAIFVDGKAVEIDQFAYSRCVNGDPAPPPVILLRKNETKSITLKVDASSIDGLPEVAHSKTIHVVAAFSERVGDIHIDESKPHVSKGIGPMHLEPPPSEDGMAHKQVAVRSNAVTLKWNGKGWAPVRQ